MGTQFAHSTFDVRNLDHNYRDIVRTARRAHKRYVRTMANESLDEVSDMQQDALDQEHPFGVRCSYSELVDALYHVPVSTKFDLVCVCWGLRRQREVFSVFISTIRV